MDLKQLIENEFNLKITEMKKMGEGLESEAFLVNGTYIFKHSKHSEAFKSMAKEVEVLNYLNGKISIDIPKIEFYSPEHHISGYKLVEGKILTPELFNGFAETEQENLAKDIALFVKEMHALKLPDIEDLEINVLEDYKSDYEYLKENIYSLLPIESQNYLDKSILNNENMTNYKKVLCHNDLSCNHILIKDNKLSGIIDFGDVAITDADKDFVYLLEQSDEEIGREFGLKVLKYYNQTNIESAVWKSDLNDMYYPIEQTICGKNIGDDKMFNEGLNKLKQMKIK